MRVQREGGGIAVGQNSSLTLSGISEVHNSNAVRCRSAVYLVQSSIITQTDTHAHTVVQHKHAYSRVATYMRTSAQAHTPSRALAHMPSCAFAPA